MTDEKEEGGRQVSTSEMDVPFGTCDCERDDLATEINRRTQA